MESGGAEGWKTRVSILPCEIFGRCSRLLPFSFDKDPMKKLLKYCAAVTGGVAVGSLVVLPAIGFTAGGIAAGSIAAS